MRQIGVPSTFTCFIDSFGSSAVEATRSRVTLFNPRGQFLLDRLADLGDRKPVEDFAEEALDEHPLGDRPGDATADEVEEVLGVHRPDGGAVTAAQDVVVEDLEDRLGGRLGLIREQEVAVRLVRGTPSSLFLDPHHTDVDTLGAVLEGALEEQVRRGVRCNMVLQGPEVEGLLAGTEEEPTQVRGRSGAFEHRLHPDAGEAAAEGDINHLKMRIATEMEALIGELPGLLAPSLQGDVADVGPFLEENLRRSAGQQNLLAIGAQEFI